MDYRKQKQIEHKTQKISYVFNKIFKIILGTVSVATLIGVLFFPEYRDTLLPIFAVSFLSFFSLHFK